MALDQETQDRHAAVRSMLVEQVTRTAPAMLSARPAPPRRDRLRIGIVTAVVMVAVVALSVAALRFGADRGAPAQGGLTPPSSATDEALPTPTIPAGVPLGRYTSAGGPVQTHTIHPNGLAIAYAFTCKGGRDHDKGYFIHIPHNGDEGGSCSGGSGSSSNKGTPGTSSVTITTEKWMRWTLTVVGIPETYVTPQPVQSPTTTAGAAVRFCTAQDLTARWQTYLAPWGRRSGQVVLTNTTGTECALAGYPLVRFVHDGVPLGHHTMEQIDERSSTEHGLRPVVLAPGGHAYSQVGYSRPKDYLQNTTGGPCKALTVHSIRVDLANTDAGAAQQGSFDLKTGPITACLNGPWGVYGKYGQLSSTVFVDYSAAKD